MAKKETPAVTDTFEPIAPAVPVPVEVPPAPPVAEPVHEAPHGYTNSTMLRWPTDQWGFTSDLRKALIRSASRIGHYADKKKLFDATLELGLKHIEARYEEATKLAGK